MVWSGVAWCSAESFLWLIRILWGLLLIINTITITTYSLTHSCSSPYRRIWDHMFATCRSSNVTDASCIIRAELNEEASLAHSSQYSPLLLAISHFMLAMILHTREQLMGSDSTGILGYLLKVLAHLLAHLPTYLLTCSSTRLAKILSKFWIMLIWFDEVYCVPVLMYIHHQHRLLRLVVSRKWVLPPGCCILQVI